MNCDGRYWLLQCNDTTKIMGPKEIYLILYNVSACVGWSVVLSLALSSLSKSVPEDGLIEGLANVYSTEGLSMYLAYSQTAALLEIAHALFGLVRSPVMVTAMQVSSRIVALVAIVYSPQAQSEYRTPVLVYVAVEGINSLTNGFRILFLLSSMGCWSHDSFLVAG